MLALQSYARFLLMSRQCAVTLPMSMKIYRKMLRSETVLRPSRSHAYLDRQMGATEMEKFRVNLMDCTDVIRNEIAQGLPQKQIALTYAMAIKSQMQRADTPDWLAINAAILSKWKMSGLERIKARAFKILRGEIVP
jgi:hypothetical protein